VCVWIERERGGGGGGRQIGRERGNLFAKPQRGRLLHIPKSDPEENCTQVYVQIYTNMYMQKYCAIDVPKSNQTSRNLHN
jgi:hypothetical protein